MIIRDRIKELRRVRAGDLAPDDRNWRTHPEAQQRAMAASLEEVGYAGALLARETEDGLRLIDGHLRAGMDPEQQVPVLVLDVDEAEAGKIMATFDPLAGMAEADLGKLEALAEDIEWDVPELGDLVNGLLPDEVPNFEPVSEDERSRLDQKSPVKCPHCGQEFTP